MKHLYLNLKRFDVPVEFGGVNRVAPVADWGAFIVGSTQDALAKYDPNEVEFAQFFPEAHLLGAVGAEPERAVLSLQVHRDDVRLCKADDAGKGLFRERDYKADALITAERDLPLVVFSADCGTVLLHDPDAGCVGAVHAGWRGCAAGIVEKTVREMVRLLGARPERILAAVGPCIGKCCFETDSDVPEAMRTSALGAEAEPYLEDGTDNQLERALEVLKEKQMKLAVATSSSYENTVELLKETKVYSYFQEIVTGNMVEHSKPAPDIYQKACEKLGVLPEYALALEDSYNGIRSGYAAGMKVIMIPDLLTDSSCVDDLLFAKMESLAEVAEAFRKGML